jgi:4-alpha-glucanotransferase
VQQRLGERIFRLFRGGGIVAEDLGVVPAFVRKTLAELQIPGYRGLRWEKDDRVYRNPHQFPEVSLVTTGTHDTETIREWWEALEDAERAAAAEVWPEFEGLRPPPAEFPPEGHCRRLASAEQAASRLCVLPGRTCSARPSASTSPARSATPTGRTASPPRWRSWRGEKTSGRRPHGCAR